MGIHYVSIMNRLSFLTPCNATTIVMKILDIMPPILKTLVIIQPVIMPLVKMTPSYNATNYEKQH